MKTPRKPKSKPSTYEFVEDYVCGGCTVRKGVRIKGFFELSKQDDHDVISWGNSEVFKNMPLEKLKLIETVKIKKERKKKQNALKKRIYKKGDKSTSK